MSAPFYLVDKRWPRLSFWDWWALITGIDVVLFLLGYAVVKACLQ